MNLESQISTIIKEESEKLIARYHEYHNQLHLEYLRKKKRLGTSCPEKKIHTPDYWKKDKKFNPFYVRRKHKSIAKAIAKKIISRQYTPNSPYIKEIEKKDGGHRKVAIYSIPDAAVSKFYFNRLLAKNKHRFSSFSYAYRNDRNVHFAIQDISIALKDNERTFIAEFDFSDFFGSISHEFLFNQFDKNGFFVSNEDRYIIKSFLNEKNVGIPQGTSISLFLANITCWSFDQKLEREGVKFSRYADDTIVWSSEYSKICNSFIHINDFSKDAGVKINIHKSKGISLLSQKGLPTEIKSSNYINFLGYELSVSKVSINKAAIEKIKRETSFLLYKNLIQPLCRTSLAGQTMPANGRDPSFTTAIMQIRRYMYGNLSKKQIKDYLSGRSKRIFFKGIMSFYPLVNDVEQLIKLDGWLLSVIFRSVQLRAKLLANWRHNRSNQFPFNLKRKQLLTECAKQRIRGKVLIEIPSFLLIQKALQKGLVEVGIERVMNPASLDYHYRQ